MQDQSTARGEHYGRTGTGELIGPYDTAAELAAELEDQFIVIESTPGYMPEDCDPFIGSYSDCVAVAHELADELEEQGYECDRGWASSGNYLAIHCTRSDTVGPDLGRMIAIERSES